MTEPKTLLQMLNAEPAPAKLDEATLIVIDAQNEYQSGALPLEGVDAALGKIAALLERARAAGTPVIHIRHMGGEGGPFDPAGQSFQIIEQVAPVGGEAVVDKSMPNSFARSSLGQALAETGRKQLVIAGFMTHMCVNSTARAAMDLGYAVTIAADATATRALPGPDGAAVSAADLQRASLAGIADLVGCVAPSEAIR